MTLRNSANWMLRDDSDSTFYFDTLSWAQVTRQNSLSAIAGTSSLPFPYDRLRNLRVWR